MYVSQATLMVFFHRLSLSASPHTRRQPRGQPAQDVNVDLHKRVAAVIAKGHFTSHNMRESELDGDQDLTLWLRSLEEVLREVLGDERMAGHQHFSFETVVDKESGEREFGPSNSAVSFQLAQVTAGPDCVPVSLVVYIDGSFIKHGIPVKPIYGMFYCEIAFICM
jgi:hypothetical protein